MALKLARDSGRPQGRAREREKRPKKARDVTHHHHHSFDSNPKVQTQRFALV